MLGAILLWSKTGKWEEQKHFTPPLIADPIIKREKTEAEIKAIFQSFCACIAESKKQGLLAVVPSVGGFVNEGVDI